MLRYEALRHAVRAHNSDTDWGGQLYVLHPLAVAERIERNWSTIPTGMRFAPPSQNFDAAIKVALLHDVIEDTTYMLPHDDFTPQEWRALQLVTRYPDETYFDYVRHIVTAAKEGDTVAAIVKLADLSHNMSDERKVGLTDEQLVRAAGLEKKRYLPSRDMIWEALGCEWWPETKPKGTK